LTVAEQLEKEDIEVEIIHVGNQTLKGCMGCNACAKNRNDRLIETKYKNYIYYEIQVSVFEEVMLWISQFVGKKNEKEE